MRVLLGEPTKKQGQQDEAWGEIKQKFIFI